MEISKKTEHSFNSLKQYHPDEIIDFVNEYFNEEEKIKLLRNHEFIEYISSDLLTLMLNNMNLVSVFNMLQNKDIFNKVNNLNIKLTPKDSPFIKDCLFNSDLVNKLNHNMIKNMIINISKDEAIDLLNEHYIKHKLYLDDIIDIAIIKKINLINEVAIIERFSKEQLIKYINGYWRNNLNYSLIDNNYVKKTLFNYTDINIEEVIYLYDYLSTKSNHNIEDVIHDLASFKSCIALHEIFGLRKSTELISNNKFGLNDIKKAFREVDISKLNNLTNLKVFIIFNIKDYITGKYDDATLNFGTIINNFKDEYLSLPYKDIENLILKKLHINTNFKSIKNIINNDFNSNITDIANNINNKYQKILNSKDTNINNYQTISDIDKIMLTLDNNISDNTFFIKVNDNYINYSINNNIIYMDNIENVDAKTINTIAKDLIKIENINYIIVKTNRKDINGIRLSNNDSKDNIVILKNKPIVFNNEEKIKSH